MERGAAGRKLFPLRLCEALEKEYITLHGRLAQSPSWLLEESDICFPKLMERLTAAATDTPGSAVRAILVNLQNNGLAFAPAGAQDEGFEHALLEKLNAAVSANECLYDPTLLDPDAGARRLAELQMARRKKIRDAGAAPPTDTEDRTEEEFEEQQIRLDEQRQLNRLLLEAAFASDVIARVDSVRLTRLFNQLHKPDSPSGVRSALCLSGGGIRSASFSLGVLQGLARHGVLDKFDYLSTVSGGGYVGSWLSTWIHRHPDGLAGVTKALSSRSAPADQKWGAKVEPEPAPIRFLRSYSRFLNPKAGFFSVDTWAWIGIYLRNLSLNWLVIIPLLLIILAAPRLYASIARFFEQSYQPVQPAFFWMATVAAISVVVCASVNRPSASVPASRPDQTRGTKARAAQGMDRLLENMRLQSWILLLGVIPMLVFLTAITLMIWGLPEGTLPLGPRESLTLITTTPLWALPHLLPYVGVNNIVVWGELIVFCGWLITLAILPRSPLRKRLLELGAMLAAGLLTWWLVARFAASVSLAGAGRHTGFQIFSFSVFPAHAYAVLAVPCLTVAVLAGMTAFIGIVSKFKWIDDEDREWWGRFGAWILIATLGWLSLSAITIFGPPLLFESPKVIAALGGVSGLLGVLLGKSSLTPANKVLGESQAKRALSALGVNTLALAAALFLAIFLACLSLLTSAALLHWWPTSIDVACGESAVATGAPHRSFLPDPQTHLDLICGAPFPYGPLAVLCIFLAAAAVTVNLNKFSLHAAYRIRIARTFLGASRGADRRPNPFTGFDPLDNVQMHELQPGLLREVDMPDLKGLVSELHDALVGKHCKPSAKILADRICSREHDQYRILKGRLESYQPGEPVLLSLQRDLVETLNRVLEVDRLDRSGLLQEFDGERAANRALSEAIARYIEHDNRIFANRLLIESAFPKYFRAYEFPPPPPHKLMHVVNLTLNVVAGRKLAWQERKAAPFAVTPMHSGSYYLGYRESRDYGGKDGISIGTAAAISGAAVSPNMGYSSSPITTLLLTLFNVRLGWWLGNPGIAGTTTYAFSEPWFSLRPLVAEAFGLTDDQSPYVYLSDGGHFENLGLFEMVLRRCHLIVVVDAGADPDYAFDDLGNAVRKIRIDLGIPIEFDAMPIHKLEVPKGDSGRYCAFGRIAYSSVDGPEAPDGLLIYFKPVLCGTEPRDVLHYAAQNQQFPQESTLNQFFGESQFESYRKLGEVAVETACSKVESPATRHWVISLVEGVRQYLSDSSCDYSWIDAWLQSHGQSAQAQTKEEGKG